MSICFSAANCSSSFSLLRGVAGGWQGHEELGAARRGCPSHARAQAHALEGLQEGEELELVRREDLGDLGRLLRVRDKDLEDMEGLDLNVSLLRAQDHHDRLQVQRIGYVLDHDLEILALEQELAQQLQRLPLEHVVVALEQLRVV